MGTSVDLYIRLGGQDLDDTSFGVALGVVSTTISIFFILVHYDFIPGCEEGGWLELSSSFFLILLWTIGVAFLTQDGAIAATLSGTACHRDSALLRSSENCTLIMYEENDEGEFELLRMSCDELPRQVPGSNLFLAVWTCFFSAVNVSFRWKAAQVLQFAQAQQEKQQFHLEDNDNKNKNDGNLSQGDGAEDDEDEI
jgi:hypothetical protein